jgi:mycothiol synthase
MVAPVEQLSAALPTGWTVRLLAYDEQGVVDADLDAITVIAGAVEVECAGKVDTSRGDLASTLTGPDVLRDHAILVCDAATAPVAASWLEVDRDGRKVWLEPYSVPGVEQAVRDAVVRYGLQVARQQRGGEPDWKVQVGAYYNELPHIQSLRRNGFQQVRRFARMYVPVNSPHLPAVPPELPAGVTIVLAATPELHRELWRAHEDSFSEHWGFTARTLESWWSHITALPGSNPENWWLLRVNGATAGLCLMDDSRAELGEAHIGILGVLPDYRGRGFARILLLRAFIRARDLGREGITLGVDSQNATGAVGLYESVGMTAVQIIDTFALPL